MKRFSFALDRVLRIRRLEMEHVEARLSELSFHAKTQRQTADQRHEEALDSGRRLLEQPDLRGADFHTARHWLARLESERTRTIDNSRKLAEQHREKMGELIEARRKVKLLETLREKKHAAHRLENARQLEAQACEFYLAKLIRQRR